MRVTVRVRVRVRVRTRTRARARVRVRVWHLGLNLCYGLGLGLGQPVWLGLVIGLSIGIVESQAPGGMGSRRPDIVLVPFGYETVARWVSQQEG